MSKKQVYMDYAATTPIDRRVFRAMLPYFTEEFDNPSNLYALGLKAKKAVAEATRKITAALNSAPDEFIFTGSATEADNLAIAGAARANEDRGNRIVISNVVKEFKWRTFGCVSAIASTSMLSVMVTEKGGMTIEKAPKIKPQDVMKRLGGLPDRKIHCSVLGDKALRAAINNWFKETGQVSRIIVEGSRVLDPNTKTTEADIEEAVLEGATTLGAVQKRTKVGIGYPGCIPAVEELIKFYREKYYGPDKK